MEKVKIYHQCGYRDKWNKEVFNLNKIGTGFIFSPINTSKEMLSDIEDDTIKESFIDPQFYSLNIYKDNYLSYEFLNEVDNLKDYSVEKNVIAKKCIDYQINRNFKYIVIPTIDFGIMDMENDYGEIYEMIRSSCDESGIENNFNNIKILQKLIINPFVEYIKEKDVKNKVLLTIIFNDEMAKNEKYFDTMLSIITDNENIQGIYLIPENDRAYKRISDINFLVKILKFIYVLRKNGMEVIVGYADIESILYTVAGATAITMGIYENLRNYDGSRFSLDSGGRSPNARMFSYSLLQWIEYVYLPIMSKEKGDLKKYFDDNEYFFPTQSLEYKWHFSKSEPYKHYMISYNNLIQSLPEDFEKRFEYVDKKLKEANDLYLDLATSHAILFDENSGGSHLNKWRTALNQFYKITKE